jgi:hypothetical protein
MDTLNMIATYIKTAAADKIPPIIRFLFIGTILD